MRELLCKRVTFVHIQTRPCVRAMPLVQGPVTWVRSVYLLGVRNKPHIYIHIYIRRQLYDVHVEDFCLCVCVCVKARVLCVCVSGGEVKVLIFLSECGTAH